MITVEMLDGLSRLSRLLNLPPEDILDQINNGSIYVFDLKGIHKFYEECDLDPVYLLEKDLKDGSVILLDSKYFMIV
mgnify:CR=1 FL=1|tara:strand:- start:3437 stop:3667 length:231 start_codon:yes stop_codon:yes gene_type:complete